MTATATNGPARRKQLSDQLDRLDTIIDALAEALPEAVADACREGARQAVRDAVVEILSNPDLRALIAGPAPPPEAPPAAPAPAGPGPWARLRATVAAARAAVAGRCRAAAARCPVPVTPVRAALLVGAGMLAGVVSGARAWGLSAVAGGVAACAAAAARVGGWFGRPAGSLGPGTI